MSKVLGVLFFYVSDIIKYYNIIQFKFYLIHNTLVLCVVGVEQCLWDGVSDPTDQCHTGQGKGQDPVQCFKGRL